MSPMKIWIGATMVANQSAIESERRAPASLAGGASCGWRSSIQADMPATAKAVVNPAVCPTSTFNLSQGSLNGFQVTVTCTRTQHDENGSPWSTFRLRSDAQRGTFGSFDYAFRRVESTVTVAGP